MVHFVKARSTGGALIIARQFIHHVVRLHGLPRSLLFDRNPRLMSQVWAHTCELLEIHRSMTSGCYPQANGQADRTKQIVIQGLRLAFAGAKKNWVLALDTVEMAISNAVLTAGGLLLYFMSFARNPCLWPGVERDATDINTLSEPLQSFWTRMPDTWTNVRDAVHAVAEECIDRHSTPTQRPLNNLRDITSPLAQQITLPLSNTSSYQASLPGLMEVQINRL